MDGGGFGGHLWCSKTSALRLVQINYIIRSFVVVEVAVEVEVEIAFPTVLSRLSACEGHPERSRGIRTMRPSTSSGSSIQLT